jgi:hypothetical protein
MKGKNIFERIRLYRLIVMRRKTKLYKQSNLKNFAKTVFGLLLGFFEYKVFYEKKSVSAVKKQDVIKNNIVSAEKIVVKENVVTDIKPIMKAEIKVEIPKINVPIIENKISKIEEKTIYAEDLETIQKQEDEIEIVKNELVKAKTAVLETKPKKAIKENMAVLGEMKKEIKDNVLIEEPKDEVLIEETKEMPKEEIKTEIETPILEEEKTKEIAKIDDLILKCTETKKLIQEKNVYLTINEKLVQKTNNYLKQPEIKFTKEDLTQITLYLNQKDRYLQNKLNELKMQF